MESAQLLLLLLLHYHQYQQQQHPQQHQHPKNATICRRHLNLSLPLESYDVWQANGSAAADAADPAAAAVDKLLVLVRI